MSVGIQLHLYPAWSANIPPPCCLAWVPASEAEVHPIVNFILINMHTLWWFLKDLVYNAEVLANGAPEGTDLSSIQFTADALRKHLGPRAGQFSSL